METERLSPWRPVGRIWTWSFFTGNFEGVFDIKIWGFFFYYFDPNDVANLSCGTEEETSVHVLCECEALVSPRHAYLGSFFFGP